LKVLFLGQVILRKGIIPLLESSKILRDYPLEFIIVGSLGITKPSPQEYPNVKWIGSVPRSMTADYYQKADVFIFPTLSDGFGLTQLEAQAWKLPIIASRCCGEVVVDGVNGWLLDEVSGEAISNLIHSILKDITKIPYFSSSSVSSLQFNLTSLFHYFQVLIN
jgi:glycosyltransferase involved in cell wall biosynthesis